MDNVGNNLINLKGITYTYPESSSSVLTDLNLSIQRDSKVGLIAPNGSGKTTLFHIIMGLLKPDTGSIEVFGKLTKKEKDFIDVRRRIGFLFQDSDDQLFCPTVIEDVAFGPLNLGKTNEEAMEISRQTLKFLGLNGFEDRITFKLSGGEKRLVSLAAVLAMQPEVLLLDEPTTGLDSQTKNRLTEILTELNLAYIVISHEYNFITSVTNHIYTMDEGKIILDDELHIHQHEHVHKLGKHPHKHV